MRFSIYGRYDLVILREGDRWAAYRVESGKRRPEAGLIVPSDIGAEAVQTYLDDILHELAQPGTSIERVD